MPPRAVCIAAYAAATLLMMLPLFYMLPLFCRYAICHAAAAAFDDDAMPCHGACLIWRYDDAAF